MKILQKKSSVPENCPENFGCVGKNPSVTRTELAAATGLSTDGVKWNLDKLKKSGKIRRIGPDRGGHWEVMS